VSGARKPGAPLTLRLAYRDAPPAGLPTADASGVAELTIRWGDGTVVQVKPRARRLVQSYRRAGRYKVTIVIVDKAGNRRTVVKRLKITTAAPAHGPAAGKHA
jgi:hypothetical protein